MGNRLSKTDTGGGINGTESYTYNMANMLLSRAGNGYTNDVDGNTLSGGGRTNTWDSQDRLVQCVNGANTSSFAYGADGIRRQSTVNGTVTDFVLDTSVFVRERRAGNNVATYLAGARGPEYRRDDSTGAVRWYLYDGLGSVVGEVDPSGTISSSRKYDVYGLVRGVSPGGTSKHKFVGSLGHPSEDETGLTYMRARYFDPSVGRFGSEDPGRHGHNWFVYCACNPINRVDASGKSDVPLTDILDALNDLFKGLTGQGLPAGLKYFVKIIAMLWVAEMGAGLMALAIAIMGVGISTLGLIALDAVAISATALLVDRGRADDGVIDLELADQADRGGTDHGAVGAAHRAAGHDHLDARMAIQQHRDIEVVGDDEQILMRGQRARDFFGGGADIDEQRAAVRNP